MKNSEPSQRQLRVGEQVRAALAQTLQRGVITDNLLERAVITITEVRMSPDLKIATCYVSILVEQDKKSVVDALNRHSRFLRGELAHSLRQLRYMPQLRFYGDDSFDNFAKIDALLKSPQVARDLVEDDGDEDDKENQ